MDLLLDTHALVWLSSADSRLGTAVAAALDDPATTPSVSVVTAWEYADLHARGRFPRSAALERVLGKFALEITSLPRHIWKEAAALPRHHRDPIDRMLVAHALVGGFTIATADSSIRKYEVPTLW